MRRLVAILNPQADRGRTARLAESLQHAMRGRVELSIRQTTRRGEAVDLAFDAAGDCDAVVAIGGDGTVHEVANGLMAAPVNQRPPMGVIPAGSGNDFAYALGVTKDFQQAIAMLAAGATRAVDVATVRSSSGRSCYCLNNVGTLLEGQVNLASHQLTWPRGSGLYLRAALQSLVRKPPAARLELCLDGRSFTRSALVLSIGNGPRSGGKFFLVPEAKIDDGQFDFMLAAPMSRARLLWELAGATRARRRPSAQIERGRFSALSIRSDIPLPVHVDGEPWLRPEEDTHGLEIHVLPQALHMLCNKSF